MILYVPLEISVRELQGHLLLALSAAARGHQTVIAATNDLWLYQRVGLLPAGTYLVKNMNRSASSDAQYRAFLEDGFTISVHEQEPSILWDSFDKFLQDYNITPTAVLPFAAVCCWGRRDTAEYQRVFRDSSCRFVETGSPRADLWTPRFSALRERRGGPDQRPYVLLVSNFGFWMGRTHWSEWLERARGNELFRGRADEERMVDFLLEESSIAMHLVQAARHLAVRRPDLRVVIRPHPLDEPEHWRRATGGLDNIEVTDTSSPLSDWIAGAAVVLQNGCTSAIEAVLQQIPLVSYGPERRQGNLLVPSRLGLAVAGLSALESVVDLCLTPGGYATAQQQSAGILEPLVTADGHSTTRMLDVLEAHAPTVRATLGRERVQALRAVRAGKGAVDQTRVTLGRLLKPSAAAAIHTDRARRDLRVMAETLGLPMPSLTRLSATGLCIGPATAP